MKPYADKLRTPGQRQLFTVCDKISDITNKDSVHHKHLIRISVNSFVNDDDAKKYTVENIFDGWKYLFLMVRLGLGLRILPTIKDTSNHQRYFQPSKILPTIKDTSNQTITEKKFATTTTTPKVYFFKHKFLCIYFCISIAVKPYLSPYAQILALICRLLVVGLTLNITLIY